MNSTMSVDLDLVIECECGNELEFLPTQDPETGKITLHSEPCEGCKELAVDEYIKEREED